MLWSSSNSRLMEAQLQPDHLAYMWQACVDWIGVCDIVSDFLLPVVFVMCIFSFLPPILYDAWILKCDTSAAGH